ncbi:MAG: fibronectin type III domain-containing protein [Lachnospiraceae bacterium]|nr:fibronectin type III domain-containing protein [Lachnospiraceae bacterium]
MGKSILKKIMAVVLTVAMVVAVIEIPPLVKAENQHLSSREYIGATKVGVEVRFSFEINEPNLLYNATAQKPSLTISAVKTDGEEVLFFDDNVTSSTEDFDIVYDDAVDVCGDDEYYSVTISNGAGSRFRSFPSQVLEFKIDKVTPFQINSATIVKNVETYDGMIHRPTFSSVIVETSAGEIQIPNTDYEVTNNSGWDFTTADGSGCTITLKTDNFTEQKTFDVPNYYIAYDIADTNVVKAYLGTEVENLSGGKAFEVAKNYTGAQLKSNYRLYNENIGTNIDFSGILPKYEKVGGSGSVGNAELVAGSDYSVEYSFGGSAVKRGGYYYCGTKKSIIHVASNTFGDISISVVGDSTDAPVVLDSVQLANQTEFPTVTYITGAQAKPYSITVYDGTTELVKDRDYTLSYDTGGALSVGSVDVTVTGIGTYSDAGSVRFAYYINAPLKVTLDSSSVEYGNRHGSTEIPSYSVTDEAGSSSSVLTSDLYDVKYGYVNGEGKTIDVPLENENMRTVGEKYVYVEGKSGMAYSGQVSEKAYFNVVPAKFPYTDADGTEANSRFEMALNPGNSTYTGTDVAQSQSITLTDKYLGQVLTEGTDYDVKYYKKSGESYLAVTECIDTGIYQVRAYGRSNSDNSAKYDSGTYAKADFSIGAINVNNATVSANTVNTNAAVYYAGTATKAPYVIYTNGTKKTILYNGDTGVCAEGITVTFDGIDGTVPKSIGQHTMVVTGDGLNFEGTLSRGYWVVKASLKELLTAQNLSVEWIGSSEYMTLPDYSKLVFKEADGHIISKDNYSIEPSGDNILPGTGKLLITPLGEYADLYDACEITYTITKRNMNHLTVDLGVQSMINNAPADYVYRYPQHKLIDKVSGNDIVIPAGAYSINYTDNTQAGNTATVTFAADAGGNYTGSISRTFYCGVDISAKGSVTLVFRDGSGKILNKDSGLVYDGNPIEPDDVIVKVDMGDDVRTLVEGTDYVKSFRNLTSGRPGDVTSAGTVEVTITAKSDSTVYFGTLTETYTINTIALSNNNTIFEWAGGETEHREVFTGEPIEPNTLIVKVDLDKDRNYEVLSPDDYELKYLNNINQTVSTNYLAYVYVATKEGSNYNFPELRNTTYQTIENSAVIQKSFVIEKADISSVGIELDEHEFDYDGKSHFPNVTVTYNDKTLEKGKDYNVIRCLDDTNSSVYAHERGILDDDRTFVEIVGTGNFMGSTKAYYEIKQLDLGNNTANVRAVLRDSNNRIVYDANRNPLKLLPTDLNLYYIYYEDTQLVEGLDYEFIDSEISALNYSPGQMNLYVHGKNNCKRFTVINIDIYRELNNTDFAIRDDANSADKLKDGDTISETRLKEAIDAGKLVDLVDVFVVSGNNTTPIQKTYYTATVDGYDIGKHTLTINGVEDQHYIGSMSISFNVAGDISADGAYIEAVADMDWTGRAVEPTVYVRLPNGKRLDNKYYTVSYSNNTDPGYAKVTVEGKDIYSGVLTEPKAFRILYPVGNLVVEWKDSSNVDDNNVPHFIYDGTSKQPQFDLFYNLNGTNHPVNGGYKVSYGNNKNAGAGSVTITADTEDENCFLKGSVTKAITIAPKEIYEGMLNPTSNYVDEISLGFYDYIPTGVFPEPGLTDILNTGEAYNLVKNSDYKLAYGSNNSIANGGTVTIKGIGNYTGTLVERINIKQKDISDDDSITVTATDASYTGEPAAPGNVSVTYTDIFGKKHILNHSATGVMDYYISGYYTLQNVAVGTRGEKKPDGSVTEAVAPKEMGEYIIEIEGIGNYTGVNLTAKYSITARSLTAASVSVRGTMEYTGNPLTPEITITDGENALTENIDYTIDYSNKLRYNDSVVVGDHTNAGTVTLTITGLGNYTGSVSKTMTITPRDIAADQATAADYGFTYAVNKSVTYANGTDRSDGRHTMPFVAGGSSVPTVLLHDTTRDVDLTCKNDGATYPDYRLTFVSQYETLPSEETFPNYAGKIVMTVEGLGNYTGSVSYTYYIGEDISGATATLTTGGYSAEYDGLYRDLKDSYVSVDSSRFNIGADQRKITVYKGAVLDDNGDLILDNRVDITKIVDADKYYIVVDGVPEKGTYAATPSMSCTYTVTPKSIFNCTIDNFPETVYYTGDYITVKGITVTDTTLPVSRDRGAATIKATLKEGVDYEIDNTKKYKDVGKATITVNGIGNYRGTAKAYFTIEQNSISGGDKDDGSTSGTGLTSDGVTITAEDIKFTYTGDGFMKYTGSGVVPSVVINYGSRNLVAGREYIVTATNNVNAGIATLTISGIGGFSGYLTKKFTIKADIAGAKVATIPDQVYTGSAVTPSLTVNCGGNTLAKGSDYTVSFDDNVAIGKASVTLTAVENSYYYGSKTVPFNISNSAKGMVVTGYASTYTYTGYAITPALVVSIDGTALTAGTDYTVSYSNNINVGTAKAVVTGKGQYSGTKTVEYRIVAKSLSNCAADLSGGNSYEYTGTTYTPAVTLTDLVSNKTLVKGTDYNVTYSNNTDPGTATVTMTALSDNYTGTKVVNFNIGSASVKGLRATDITWKTIKLKWAEQEYATGYQICDKNNKVIGNTKKNKFKVTGLTSYTTYSYKVRSYVKNKDGSVSYGGFSEVLSEKTKLKTPKLTAKAAGGGKVMLKWTKSRLATGYEIYYATEKNGVYTKLKTVSADNNRTVTDAGLAPGERYFYTVRAYRNVDGTKEYSNYNTIKTVKVR